MKYKIYKQVRIPNNTLGLRDSFDDMYFDTPEDAVKFLDHFQGDPSKEFEQWLIIPTYQIY